MSGSSTRVFLQTAYRVLDVAQARPRFFNYRVCPAAHEYGNRQRRWSRGNNLLDRCAPAPAQIGRTRITNEEGYVYEKNAQREDALACRRFAGSRCHWGQLGAGTDV